MTIRVGIVGCGAIAEAMHLPALTENNATDLQLSALADPDEARLSYLSEKFSVSHTATSIEGIADAVDAVVVCTPPHLHLPVIKKAFQADLHVLCEKPMANSLDECDKLLDIAEKADRVFAMAHFFRFYPSRIAIKRIIDEKKYGKVISVSVAQGNPYSWETVSGYNMKRELVPGGVLIDAGIHPLDTLLWWHGDPELVEYKDDALGGLESNAQMDLSFPGDAFGTFRISRTCQLDNFFRLQTEEAKITLFAYNPWQYEVEVEGKKRQVSIGDKQVTAGECAAAQLEDFAQSIISGRSPAVDGKEGARVIRLIDQCYQVKKQRALPKKAPIPGIAW